MCEPPSSGLVSIATEVSEWEEDVVPTADLLPKYNQQEHYMVFNLLSHANIQGISSNIQGDTTCVSESSKLLEFYPRQTGESMKDYAIRVLGFGSPNVSEEQQQARDKMASLQMENEWNKMHAYHFAKFSTEASSSSSSLSLTPSFVSSTLRRTAPPSETDQAPSKRQRDG